MLLLQEIEDRHLELCEREPSLPDKVTEVIEALVVGRRMDHIKGSTLHNLKNSDRRGAPPTSGSCSSQAKRQAVLLVAGDKTGNWRALVRHEDPDRRVSLRANGSRNRRANEREEADGPTVVGREA